MAITAQSIVRSVRRIESPWPLPRVLTAGAWFFVLFSLASLAWVVGVKWTDPSGTTTLYEATRGLETHRAIMLTYGGMTGLVLAILQLGSVSTAALMSTLPKRRLRRLGHGMLLSWAAIWMLNLIHLAGVEPGIVPVAQAGMMTALFGCTVYRARRRPAARPQVEVDADAPVADAPKPAFATDGAGATPEGRATARWFAKLAAAHQRSRARAEQAVATARPKMAPIVAKARAAMSRGAQRVTGWLRAKGVIPQSRSKSTVA